jgi:hypothetical protein
MTLVAPDLVVHPSLRDSFIPLPNDPEVPLTPEQLRAVFPNPEAWRDVIQLTLNSIQQKHQANENQQPTASH